MTIVGLTQPVAVHTDRGTSSDWVLHNFWNFGIHRCFGPPTFKTIQTKWYQNCWNMQMFTCLAIHPFKNHHTHIPFPFAELPAESYEYHSQLVDYSRLHIKLSQDGYLFINSAEFFFSKPTNPTDHKITVQYGRVMVRFNIRVRARFYS